MDNGAKREEKYQIMESLKVSITLPERALKALDEMAEEKTVTRSALIRIAVAEYIKREKGEEKGK